ncbi:MAG: thiamine phosphate synthase [Solirubrobacteraceae bacterium]|nr:thiamine phosphate synthase [Solirubrobacteraceae bacterium]
MPRTRPDASPSADAGAEASPTADAVPEAPDPRRVLAARRLRLLESDLYLVIGPVEGKDLEQTVLAAIEGGVDIVQLRAKDAPDEELIAVGAHLARLCHDRRVMFIINDRPDLVEPIGADGVHVGQDDLSVAEARKIAGPSALVGVSTHSEEQLAQAAKDGADYAGVGPVHTTPTKPGRPATGYRYVHHASLHAELPWFAIGGIDAETVDRTLASGAERIVVVRAIAEADDPRAAAAQLKQAIADRPKRKSAEERNAAVRAELKPFEPGERPAAAAMAAILLAAVGLVNLLMWAIGYQPREALRTDSGTAAQITFGVLAVGLSFAVWRLKAWALLLLQALLGITALACFVGLIIAQTVRGAALTLVLMLICGALFYKLVRVLARAQTPRTPAPLGASGAGDSNPTDPS